MGDLLTVAQDIDRWALTSVSHPNEKGRVQIYMTVTRGAVSESIVLDAGRDAARAFGQAILASTGDAAESDFSPDLLSGPEPVAAAVLPSMVASPAPAGIQRAAAEAQGFTGDSCTNCGAFAMRRAGTCLTCQACGSTTGCA